MPALGKHRRTRTIPLAHRLIALGTGTAALALPLVAAASANAAPAPQQVTAAPSAATAAKTTHTVVKGESLAKIAKARSVSGGWQALYKNNKSAVGDNPSLIRPGLKLKLAGAPKAAPTATAEKTDTVQTAAKSYTNDLDGWIRESLDIMAQNGIPGSYDGIHRNIMRESGGNPQAINNWDSNAAAGTRRRACSRSSPRRSRRTTCPAPRPTATTRSPTSPPRATTRPTATARSTTSTARTKPAPS